MARHETRPFLELTRIISHRFQAEEIEVSVTKKLCQEFSRTESRILGALSKLNEFRLNPQVRTHSGTVPKTLRNTIVENQKPNEDRSQDDLHPELGPSVCRSRHSNDSDPDKFQEFKKRFAIALTWRQEFEKRFPSAPMELPQENKRRPVSQVSHNFAMKTPLRQKKQTRFCKPFNNWRRTVIQLISTKTTS